MKVRITRHVPGLVNFRPLVAGTEHDLEGPVAVSLIGDGYAVKVDSPEPVRTVPAERRETATATPGKRAPGRPARNG